MTDPANGRVYELRVHGVSGTPPESILGEPFPQQVAGDDVARFFRATEPVTTLPGGENPQRSRIVEAFHWGRFTSGGANRALWLLLVPFALLNLSRYMLLGKGKFADGVLRLLGVVLTSILVTNIAYLSLELVVRQCANSELCLHDNEWLDFMASWPFGAQLLLGVAPVVVVISLLWWFGRQTFLYEPQGALHEWGPEHGTLRDHAFWHTSPKAPVLRAAHVAVACTVAGILCGGALNTAVPHNTAPPWLWLVVVGIGVVLLVCAVVGIANPPSAELRPDRQFNDTLRVPRKFSLLKWGSLGYFAISVVLSVVCLWNADGVLTTPLAGFEVVTMVQGGLAALLLGALFFVCFGQRGALGDLPDHARKAFRPMWFGFAAWITAAFATMLAAGFSSGFAYRVADLLGEPVGRSTTQADVVELSVDVVERQIELSAAYWTGVVLWGAVTIVFLVLLLLLGSGFWLWFGRWRSNGLDGIVARDYVGEDGVQVNEGNSDEPQPRGIGKIAKAWRLAQTKYHYHWAFGTISVLGGALVVTAGVAALIRMVFDRANTDAPAWLFDDRLAALDNIGGWVVSGLAAGLVVIGVRSWQGQRMRTVVGVLWDLIAFWPRYAHPICPPPYGGRATLELASRANYLANQSEENRVVLSGHSQGSVVSVAAVLVLAHERTTDDDSDHCYLKSAEAKNTVERLRLVTYGSQLQWAFARLFPRYLGYAELVAVNEVLGGCWRNAHRWTDPLGGPVLVWQSGTTPISEMSLPYWHGISTAGGLQLDQLHAGGADSCLWGWRLGSEIRLRDPEFIESRNDRPRSRLRRHSGYYDDPVFDEVVADVADAEPSTGNQPPPVEPPPGPPPIQPPTYRDE